MWLETAQPARPLWKEIQYVITAYFDFAIFCVAYKAEGGKCCALLKVSCRAGCRGLDQLWSSGNVTAGVQHPGGAHTPCQVPVVQERAWRYLRECCWAGLQQQINLFAVTSLLFSSLKHLWVTIQPTLEEPGHSWLATKLRIKNSFSRWAQLCAQCPSSSHSTLHPHATSAACQGLNAGCAQQLQPGASPQHTWEIVSCSSYLPFTALILACL